jgi:hypothetical protein
VADLVLDSDVASVLQSDELLHPHRSASRSDRRVIEWTWRTEDGLMAASRVTCRSRSNTFTYSS